MRLTRPEQLLLYGPLAVVLLLWLIIPALLGLVATVTDYAPAQPAVQWVGLHNFQVILGDRTFAACGAQHRRLHASSRCRSNWWSGSASRISCAARFTGARWSDCCFLLPWLVSPVASGVMWHFLFGSETGFLNFAVRSLGLARLPSPLSQHGLALVTVVAVESWRVAPLVTFLLLPNLAAIPRERWEDSQLDGLSTLGTIRHVALPGMRSLILAVSMLLIGGAWRRSTAS